MYNIPGASYLALPLPLPLPLQLTASDCLSPKYLSGSAPKINKHAVAPPPPPPFLPADYPRVPLATLAPGGKFMSTDEKGLSANS